VCRSPLLVVATIRSNFGTLDNRWKIYFALKDRAADDEERRPTQE
jgi:hypothetical protein